MKEHTNIKAETPVPRPKAIEPPVAGTSRAHNCSPTWGLTPFRSSHGTIKPTRKDSVMRKQIGLEMIRHRLQLVAARIMFCAAARSLALAVAAVAITAGIGPKAVTA